MVVEGWKEGLVWRKVQEEVRSTGMWWNELLDVEGKGRCVGKKHVSEETDSLGTA